MSDGKNQDNPNGYILIDATKRTGMRTRKKATNSKVRAKRKKQEKVLYCVLCGHKIMPGELLAHKESAHGETPVPKRTLTFSRKSHWIKLLQGGLPSLGKRK